VLPAAAEHLNDSSISFAAAIELRATIPSAVSSNTPFTASAVVSVDAAWVPQTGILGYPVRQSGSFSPTWRRRSKNALQSSISFAAAMDICSKPRFHRRYPRIPVRCLGNLVHRSRWAFNDVSRRIRLDSGNHRIRLDSGKVWKKLTGEASLPSLRALSQRLDNTSFSCFSRRASI
jgi:hypothetical protein